MQFIPDQGWFYLSARDMILTHMIPLVGPPTSHPWIHHGPLWTYALALFLTISRFDPVGPAYFIAVLGSITVFVFYKTTLQIYSRNIAFFAGLLFATSPLVVMNSRIPYHTSPIPFFVIILFYCSFLWIKGNVKIFPLIILLLAILYNHEITTAVYGISILILFIFGIIKKKQWVKNLKNRYVIFLSSTAFLVPMLPFITYDVTHGYPQTVKFGLWVIYRVIKLPLSFLDKSFISSGSNPSTIPQLLTYVQQLFFVQSLIISTLLLLGSVFFFLYIFILKKQRGTSNTLLFLFLAVSIFGLFTHRVPIEADILLVSPFLYILLAILLDNFVKQKFLYLLSNIIVLAIVVMNVYAILSSNFFTTSREFRRIPMYKYIEAVNSAIDLTGGKSYTIKGKGELSNFPVFLMPYEYMLWWKGHPVSKFKEKTIIEFWEKDYDISVSLVQ